MKICSRCGISKALEQFSINRRNKTDGRQPKCKACNAIYQVANSEREKTRAAKWYRDNHKTALERRAELRTRPEAKIKKAKQDKEYALANKDRIKIIWKNHYAKNKQRVLERSKLWIKNNPERAKLLYRIRSQKRRAAFRKVFRDLTLEEASDIIQKGVCYYCGNSGQMTLDHVVPISKGGPHTKTNIVPACSTCNSSKGSKLLDEWNDLTRSKIRR